MRYALPLALVLSAAVSGGRLTPEPRSGQAGQPDAQRALTAADYARAERFLGYNTTPLVLHGGVRPTWLPDDRFWYRVSTENGNEFVLIDPARGSRSKPFDQAKLAAALSMA